MGSGMGSGMRSGVQAGNSLGSGSAHRCGQDLPGSGVAMGLGSGVGPLSRMNGLVDITVTVTGTYHSSNLKD